VTDRLTVKNNNKDTLFSLFRPPSVLRPFLPRRFVHVNYPYKFHLVDYARATPSVSR
jgi:hypothetical protein